MSSVNSTPMLSLEDLLLFNEQLLLLDRAGMPLAIDAWSHEESLETRLSKISAHAALQVGRNRSLSDALADVAQVPERYVQALYTWHTSGRHPSALEILVRPAETLDARRSDVGASLIQPIILLSLVYAGLLFLVWQVVPTMEVMFRESRSASGTFLNILLFLRRTEPIWKFAYPIIAVISIVLWFLRSKRWQYSWVPGSEVANRSIELSARIDGIASCLSSGYRLQAAGDRLCVIPSAEPRLSVSVSPSTSTNTHQAVNMPSINLSPLVRWATSAPAAGALAAGAENDPTQLDPGDASSQVTLLRHVANAYRGRAASMASRWRRWLPLVIGSLLGGLIVLPYGLMLFGPMIELLLEICQPRRAG